MRSLIIDAHLHLFDASKGRYEWWSSLPEIDREQIAKSFFVNDLLLPTDLSLAGIVHIEAGYDNQGSWHEIDNVEAQCKDMPLASIGCIDLTLNCNDFVANLQEFKQRRSFRGLRHILDENAKHVLNHPNTKSNLSTLNQEDFIFELQMSFIDHNVNTALFHLLDHAPELRFAINHAGFAPLSLPEAARQTKSINNEKTWKSAINQLATYPNSVVKCSGWEMQNRTYDNVAISPFISYLSDTFGENRLLFASNFPLTLFSKSYSDYWCDITKIITALGLDPTQVLHENARKFYRFG